VAKSLGDMHRLLLAPLGVVRAPSTIAAALDAYLEARMRLEEIYAVKVSRELQREVEPVVRR
jgi:succinate dehydrogenase/fumarate reductase flavoprotein subunit